MQQTAWLIYSEQDALENKSYIQWFIEEATKQHIELKLVLRENIKVGIFDNKHAILLNDSITEPPLTAIVRTVEPILNLHLEMLGTKVFNSSSIATICNHKALTHFEVSKLDIPMVDTIFIKKDSLVQTPPLRFPFVIKEATGRGGKQVFYIQNNQDWQECMTSLASSELIIQTSNVQLGKDIRVFIVGKMIIGAILRESKTDFKANFKLGGSAKWYHLRDQDLSMIKKIIDYFDFGMVGIDFLIDYDGNLKFNEIEDVVGSRTLSAVSDVNILEKYMTHIKNKTAVQ